MPEGRSQIKRRMMGQKNAGGGARKISIVRCAAVLICLVFLGAGGFSCSSRQAAPPETGSQDQGITWLEVAVTYGDGSFLPPGAVLTLTLEEVYGTDVFRGFIGETVTEVEGAPPYVVSLGYNPKLIHDNRRYLLRAEIRHYDRLLYTTRTLVDPFSKEAETPVVVRMDRVPRPKRGAAGEN